MKFRKFYLENANKGVRIPSAAMSVSGFREEAVEGHALDDAVVLLKKEMCASELLRAAGALTDLAIELYSCLNDACGRCEHCSDPCPYGPEDYIIGADLLDALREAVGIPKFQEACGDSAPILRDVPPHIMQALLALGGCPDDLLDHIVEGDIIYGGE